MLKKLTVYEAMNPNAFFLAISFFILAMSGGHFIGT